MLPQNVGEVESLAMEIIVCEYLKEDERTADGVRIATFRRYRLLLEWALVGAAGSARVLWLSVTKNSIACSQPTIHKAGQDEISTPLEK